MNVVSTVTAYGGGQEGGKVCDCTVVQVIDRPIQVIQHTYECG